MSISFVQNGDGGIYSVIFDIPIDLILKFEIWLCKKDVMPTMPVTSLKYCICNTFHECYLQRKRLRRRRQWEFWILGILGSIYFPSNWLHFSFVFILSSIHYFFTVTALRCIPFHGKCIFAISTCAVRENLPFVFHCLRFFVDTEEKINFFRQMD